MIIPTSFDPWRKQALAPQPDSTAPRIGRRTFTHSTLAAAALAALPMRRTWAQAVKTAAIPAKVDAIGLAGNPVSLPAAGHQGPARGIARPAAAVLRTRVTTRRAASGTPPSTATRR